ncbi:MAG: flagellar motor switch protein FliM [Francisellaceae bacterium]|nr:flagellar motor switch protein FliM [Francisellaceae bacterium]
MSTDQILSQEEIDALLGANDEEEFEEDEESTQIFDFSHDRIVRGRMPTLEMINERFVRHLRSSLFGFMRKTIEVSTQGIEVLRYSEYTNSLFLPTSINVVKMKPLRGQSLFVLDSKLVYMFVDNYFGGEGNFYHRIEGRDFTPTENRIIMRLLEMFFEEYKKAFKSAVEVDFELVGAEVNPSMVNILSPSETIIVNKFRIEFDGGSGEFHFSIPYGKIEPIRDILYAGVQSDSDDLDSKWATALQHEIIESEVTAKAIVATKELLLKEIVAFKVGDVIPINMLEKAVMINSGVPTHQVLLGISNGLYALKVLNPISYKDDKSNE